MRLRYTGPQPTVFNHLAVTAVDPGDEFDVPEDDAPGFLTRADIEPAPAPAADEPADEPEDQDGAQAEEAPAPARAKRTKTPPARAEVPDTTELT